MATEEVMATVAVMAKVEAINTREVMTTGEAKIQSLQTILDGGMVPLSYISYCRLLAIYLA